MTFDREKEALDAMYAGLDKACRAGVYSLQEAAGLMSEVVAISTLLNGGMSGILAQIIQPSAEPQATIETQPTMEVDIQAVEESVPAVDGAPAAPTKPTKTK